MVIKNPIQTLQRLPAYVLLSLMLIFPMVKEMLYIKVLFFILLLVMVFISTILQGRLKLHPQICLWALFMTSVIIIFAFRGFIADTPGALKQAQVYGLWPLIYLFLISGAVDSKIWFGIQRTMVISTICIATYGLLYVFMELQLIPQFIDLNFFENESAPAIGYYGGFIQLRVLGLNSLPFLIPYCITALIFWPKEKKQAATGQACLWVAVFLGITIDIFSARRALWLVTLLTPLFIFILWLFLVRKDKLTNIRVFIFKILLFIVLLSILYILLSKIYKFNMAIMAEELLGGFDIYGIGKSEIARSEQLDALIRGWLEHPMLGSGLGASAEAYGSVRSEMPWAYELYYLSLLYQVGIIGFIFLASGVVWTYYMGIKIIKHDKIFGCSILPILVGMLTMLIANATNPYLVRFDGIWAIFLPLIPINIWLLKQKQQKTFVERGPSI